MEDKLQVVYYDRDIPNLEYRSGFIYLYSSKILKINGAPVMRSRFSYDKCDIRRGESVLFDLGISITLPEKYEAWIFSLPVSDLGLVLRNDIEIINADTFKDESSWKLELVCVQSIVRIPSRVPIARMKLLPVYELEIQHI